MKSDAVESALKAVREQCVRFAMLDGKDKIICAVSGGADSMCLLELMRRICAQDGIELRACHYNHNLRGSESDGDAQFVREYCRERRIYLYEGSGDVAGASSEDGTGIEETARRLRYDFFEECSRDFPGCVIATAHNADDNAETVIMNIMRGSGAKGMCGIPPVRGIYIRPLLPLSRAKIEECLAQMCVPHREDSTNAKDDVLRNRVRHSVIPALKELCPDWSERQLETGNTLRRDEEYLNSLARQLIGDAENEISASVLSDAPVPVAARAVRTLSGGRADSVHIDAVLRLAGGTNPSGEVNIPGMKVRREYDKLIFGGEETCSGFSPQVLKPEQWVEIAELGKRFYLKTTDLEPVIYNSFTSYVFKKDAVCGIITARPRLAGDSITMPGRGKKTLKKLFIENKIPALQRERIPVIADEQGVLAVCGVGADKRAMSGKGDKTYTVYMEDSGL